MAVLCAGQKTVRVQATSTITHGPERPVESALRRVDQRTVEFFCKLTLSEYSFNIQPMSPRKLHAQPIYLESEKAGLLDQLSSEVHRSKADLLREAVDDLLVKHGKADITGWYLDIVMALKAGLVIAGRYSSTSKERVWLGKCGEFRNMANNVLASLGRK